VVSTLAVAALALVQPSCLGVFGLGADSASVGTHSRGRLIRGSRLPSEGLGYRVGAPWRGRQAQFATPGLLRAITDGLANVERLFPGSEALVGDLSRRGGGPTKGHRSHQSGRDADIFFFARTEEGRAYQPQPRQHASDSSPASVLAFGADGWATHWSMIAGWPQPERAVPRVRFDEVRNWALVRYLLTQSEATVQWIFIQRDLKSLLLAEAVALGESAALIARAEQVMHQPSDSALHNDHLHVRIYCSPFDRSLGCQDVGPKRWLKKRWKYAGKSSQRKLVSTSASTPAAAPR